MTKKFLIFSLVLVLFHLGIIWTPPAIAGLPTGNRLKDPYAILRNALPVEQKELRELQNKLESTGEDLRGNKWTALNKAASRSEFLVINRKSSIIESLPQDNQDQGQIILSELKENLEKLKTAASTKNKDSFIETRRKSLKQIGDLEALLLTNDFPYTIPKEFDKLPRLLGRSTIEINTSKGKMNAIIDGYNAPITAGNFIDLASQGFYDGLPINRAEEFFILQTGDPKGSETGYIDPKSNELRKIPLEIRSPNKKETIYNQTFEELGLYTETPVLPFATLGTMGWAHSEENLDDGSSQFFFFLYEAELNPAGRNLIDGRNSAFGYVIDGSEILNKLGVDDQIISIKILDGIEKLKKSA